MAAFLSPGDIGLFILVGLIFGVVAATHPRTFKPAGRPFLALAKTIRPLLLPLFAVLAVGTIKFSPFWQILISAALLLIAWHLILNPERVNFKKALSWEGLIFCMLVKQFAVILAVGIPAILLLRDTLADTSYFRSIGDLASTMLLLALGVWLVAFLLRLTSHATSWLRTFVALFLTLASVRSAMVAGLLPGDSSVSGVAPALFVFIAIGFLVFEAFLDMAAAKRKREPDLTGSIWSAIDVFLKLRKRILPKKIPVMAGRWGFGAALMATAILSVSVVYGLFTTAQPGDEVIAHGGERARREIPGRRPGAIGNPLTLAKIYAPVLAFTHEERWSPIAVDSYLQEARLKGPPGTAPTSASKKPLPHFCPGLAASPCYVLTIHCKKGGECAERKLQQERNNNRLYREGAVYFRVLRKKDEKARKREKYPPPDVFVDRGPFRKKLSILIQYWYFYRYDEWQASVFAGQLIQRHEGDWEAVTVGLSSKKPLFVAYSAHCTGTWSYWREIEVSNKFPAPRTHPLVAVAQGSHANYPKADQSRSPDWASCAHKLPAGTSTAISYASNIRDKTEYGWQWYPSPKGGWRKADTSQSPMNFPGTWGANDTTTLVDFKSNRLNKGPGPRTPSQQSLWEKPISWIFCESFTGPKEPIGCEGE